MDIIGIVSLIIGFLFIGFVIWVDFKMGPGCATNYPNKSNVSTEGIVLFWVIIILFYGFLMFV